MFDKGNPKLDMARIQNVDGVALAGETIKYLHNTNHGVLDLHFHVMMMP